MRDPDLPARKPALNLAQRVALGTGLQLSGKLAVLAFSLVSIRISTNYLGVAAFGDFAIVLTGATLALAAGDLGLTMVLAREISKEPKRSDEIAGNLLTIRLATCAAIVLASLVVVPLLPFSGRIREGLIVAIIGSALGVLCLFPTAFFQVHLRLGLSAFTDIAVRGLAVGLTVLVVLSDRGFLALVAATPVAWGFGVLLTFALVRRFWRVRARWDAVELRRLVRVAAPLSLVAVLGLIHFKIDAVMMSFISPAADVGIYTVAYAPIEQSLILPGLFMAAVFPILTRLLHAEDAASAEVIDKSLRFLAVLGLLVAIALFTLAQPFVELVANADFSAAVTPLRILSFALVPLFAAAVLVNLLISLGDLKLLAVISGIGIVVNVALNAYFIPRYSYNGAAATTVFSETLGLVLIALLGFRVGAFTIARSLVVRLATLLAVAAPALAVTAFLPWWTAAPLALIIVTVAAFTLRVVTKADLRLVFARAS